MKPGRLISRRQLVVSLAGSALTLACGPRGDQPVAVAFGRDQCAWCRMTVDDPRLAAEWIASGESPQVFGEPGCLVAWLAAHPGTPGAAWLRVHDDERWHQGNEVVFARGAVRTPMAFNLTAHMKLPTAASSGMTWDQLLQKGSLDARPT